MSDVAAAWDDAVALYGRPGVREACLALQDRRGADVIVILALIHLAVARAAPAESRLAAALAEIAPWHAAAIGPLRATRRSLKNWRFADRDATAAAEAARHAVSMAERAAERAELAAFLAALDKPDDEPGDPVAAAARLLSTYWRVGGLDHDQVDRTALAVVVAQAFPEDSARAAGAVERAFSA